MWRTLVFRVMGALNKDKEEGVQRRARRQACGEEQQLRSLRSVAGSHPGLTEPHSGLAPRGRRCPEPNARGAFPEAELECLLSLLFPERNRPFPPFPVARTLICRRKAWEHLVGGSSASGNILCIRDSIDSPGAPEGQGWQLGLVTWAAARGEGPFQGTAWRPVSPGRHGCCSPPPRRLSFPCFIFLPKIDTILCLLLPGSLTEAPRG